MRRYVACADSARARIVYGRLFMLIDSIMKAVIPPGVGCPEAEGGAGDGWRIDPRSNGPDDRLRPPLPQCAGAGPAIASHPLGTFAG